MEYDREFLDKINNLTKLQFEILREADRLETARREQLFSQQSREKVDSAVSGATNMLQTFARGASVKGTAA